LNERLFLGDEYQLPSAFGAQGDRSVDVDNKKRSVLLRNVSLKQMTNLKTVTGGIETKR